MQYQEWFYIVLLAQIFVLSWYLPNRLLRRLDFVFKNYPPEQYPKLYPKPMAYYERARNTFINLNRAIFLVGIVLLIVLINLERSGAWDATIVTWLLFLQLSPLMIVGLRSPRYFKFMRDVHSGGSRRAVLQPRKVFDYISPLGVWIAMATYVGFIALIAYIRTFDFSWFGGYLNVLGITFVNLLFAGLFLWQLYGKKQDPHQDHEDRMRQVRLVGKQMIVMSIAATLFVALDIILAALDLRALHPITRSLFLQLTALVSFQMLRVDTINFEVYRADVAAA